MAGVSYKAACRGSLRMGRMRSSSIDASAMRSVPQTCQVCQITGNSIEQSGLLSSAEQDRTTPASRLHLLTAAFLRN